MVERRPVRHQVRVRDQYAWCVRVRAKHAHRLSRLDAKRLVNFEVTQRPDDAIKAFPIAGGAADAAVHNEFLGFLGNFGIKVVHQHPHRRFGQPAAGGDFWTAGCPNCACVVKASGHVILFRNAQTQGRLRGKRARSAGWAWRNRKPRAGARSHHEDSHAFQRAQARVKRWTSSAHVSHSLAPPPAIRSQPLSRRSPPWRKRVARRARPSTHGPPGWQRSGSNRRIYCTAALVS